MVMAVEAMNCQYPIMAMPLGKRPRQLDTAYYRGVYRAAGSDDHAFRKRTVCDRYQTLVLLRNYTVHKRVLDRQRTPHKFHRTRKSIRRAEICIPESWKSSDQPWLFDYGISFLCPPLLAFINIMA